MSGEAGGGPGIESGGTGVTVLESPKTSPVPESSASTEAPLEHTDGEIKNPTASPDTPPEESIPLVDPSSKDRIETPIKEITPPKERDAKSEIISAKEMLRQKLTHDFIKASETDPEKKSESVIKGDLEANKTKLTPEQIELLEIYRKQTNDEPKKPDEKPTDEYIFKLVDTVRDQIAKEALERHLLSGSHLLPLVDEESPLYKKLQETAFIDDPELLIEVFDDPERVSVELAKIQMKINEIKDDPDSQDELIHLLELNKLLPKVIKDFSKILESQNITDLFKDIAEGLKPELVRGISEFSQDITTGLTEVLKKLMGESGVKIDPSKLQQGFKKYGKIGLLAALGLMYALMKSGKEQSQGYQ